MGRAGAVRAAKARPHGGYSGKSPKDMRPPALEAFRAYVAPDLAHARVCCEIVDVPVWALDDAHVTAHTRVKAIERTADVQVDPPRELQPAQHAREHLCRLRECE